MLLFCGQHTCTYRMHLCKVCVHLLLSQTSKEGETCKCHLLGAFQQRRKARRTTPTHRLSNFVCEHQMSLLKREQGHLHLFARNLKQGTKGLLEKMTPAGSKIAAKVNGEGKWKGCGLYLSPTLKIYLKATIFFNNN